MNEQIKELALNAGLLNYIDNETPRTYFINGHADIEEVNEFAELIVQECVRYLNEDYQRDFDTLWREDLSKRIKQHFGVEE